MKKKNRIILVFSVLILATILFFAAASILVYRDEVAHDDGFLVGLAATVTAIFGAYLVLYEADLFLCVFYFALKPRTKAKSVLNILANLTLILVFLSGLMEFFIRPLLRFEFLPFLLFGAYVLLRLAHLVLSLVSAKSRQP